MRHTLLVSGDVAWPLEVAAAWREAGDDVSVLLLDAAVNVARAGSPQAHALRAAIESGITVGVEESALRRRGIAASALAAGLKLSSFDEIADAITEGSERVVWL